MDEPKSEINITPLVDVCLVLLIIFMVITPMMTGSVPLSLPETVNPDSHAESPKQTVLSIQQDGSVYLETERLLPEQLASQLEELHQRKPLTEIVVRADHRLPYGKVRGLMDALSGAGFHQIQLVVQRES